MTSMLAQKMREGIAISKPLKKHYDEVIGGEVYACAIGAALLACGAGRNFEALEECTQTPLMQVVKHPITGENHGLEFVIVELNDDYDWSREKIADWVEEVTRDWE